MVSKPTVHGKETVIHMTDYQKKEIDFLREVVLQDNKAGWKRYDRYLNYKYLCGYNTMMLLWIIITGVVMYYFYMTPEWQYAMATMYGPLILISYVALATVSTIWLGHELGLRMLDGIINNWKENRDYDGDDWLTTHHYTDW